MLRERPHRSCPRGPEIRTAQPSCAQIPYGVPNRAALSSLRGATGHDALLPRHVQALPWASGPHRRQLLRDPSEPPSSLKTQTPPVPTSPLGFSPTTASCRGFARQEPLLRYAQHERHARPMALLSFKRSVDQLQNPIELPLNRRELLHRMVLQVQSRSKHPNELIIDRQGTRTSM